MSVFLTCTLGVCVKQSVSDGGTWPRVISLYYTLTQKQVYYIIRVSNDFLSHLNDCHYHLQKCVCSKINNIDWFSSTTAILLI